MKKDFFYPLKEPLTKDPLLLYIMILVGVMIIGFVYCFNSLPLIVLLSLSVFFVSMLVYCYIKNHIINNQNKKKL